MANIVSEVYDYKPFSASLNVLSRGGMLAGVLCTSSSSGTITVYDDDATGTARPVTAVMSITAGVYYPIPAGLSKGCYIVVGGTLTATAFVK